MGGSTWTIDEGNDYPHLAWEGAAGVLISEPEVTMEGSGTGEHPWIIASLDDFLLVSSGTYFWDKHCILDADIDLSGVTFNRALIGYDNGNRFTGFFDGDGHVVSNLTIKGGGSLGLFGFIGEGGYVSNLGVSDINIDGIGGCIGGLVAYNDDGHVTNCYSTGFVKGRNYVGGLVGCNNYGNVTSCYSDASVDGNSDRVGGLVGL